MTLQQKDRITYLRGDGKSYAKIAADTGISQNTIKSFCRRNNLGAVCSPVKAKASGEVCAECRSLLVHTSGAKKKRFCSDKCRMAWC